MWQIMPAGRPSTYSEKTADAICERIATGESLRAICAENGMPGLSTVFGWLDKHKYFRNKCAHAREVQADVMADMVLDTAISCTAASAIADKVKISAFQWRAAKLKPKSYGEKVTNEITGANGAALPPMQIIVQAAKPRDEAN